MTNKVYDRIKNAALILAPILTFIASLVTIWGLPYGEAITATIASIDTLLGGIVLVAKKIYDSKNSTEDED